MRERFPSGGGRAVSFFANAFAALRTRCKNGNIPETLARRAPPLRRLCPRRNSPAHGDERFFSMTNGYVHSIETAGALDGPGLRYVLFLSGCPFRCKFCHNPDAWTAEGARLTTPENAYGDIAKYAEFFKFSNGGVTLSGGEPLSQPGFCAKLLEILSREKIHSAIDTCGGVALDGDCKRATLLADMLLLDIKHADAREHMSLTGVAQKNTLDFLEFIESNAKRYWIRCVLIPDYTATPEYAKTLVKFLERRAPNAELVELLPYHAMGRAKWERLGIEYPLKDLRPASNKEVSEFAAVIEEGGFQTKYPR